MADLESTNKSYKIGDRSGPMIYTETGWVTDPSRIVKAPSETIDTAALDRTERNVTFFGMAALAIIGLIVYGLFSACGAVFDGSDGTDRPATDEELQMLAMEMTWQQMGRSDRELLCLSWGSDRYATISQIVESSGGQFDASVLTTFFEVKC